MKKVNTIEDQTKWIESVRNQVCQAEIKLNRIKRTLDTVEGVLIDPKIFSRITKTSTILSNFIKH